VDRGSKTGGQSRECDWAEPPGPSIVGMEMGEGESVDGPLGRNGGGTNSYKNGETGILKELAA